MASALFQLRVADGTWGTAGEELIAAASANIEARIADLEGVDSVTWEFHGTHAADAVAPTITYAGTPLGSEISFPLPAGVGQAYGLTAHVNRGAAVTGIAANTAMSAVRVAFANANEPVFIGETYEADSTHATVPKFNLLLENMGGGGGTSAVGGGFRYTLSALTADADPTSGTARLSDADHAAALFLYIDLTSFESGDVTAWLDGFTRGDVWVSAINDPTAWAQYSVTGAVVSASGYRKIPIDYIDGNGTLPTTAGGVFIAYDRSSAGATLSDDPPENVNFAAAYQGNVDEAARVDHKHSLDSGEPTETTDLVPVEGTADTVMRSDARIAHGVRGGGTLHPVASAAAGAGFAPDPTGVTTNFVIAVVSPGVLGYAAPVTAPTADEGLLPSDMAPQDIVSDGAESAGVGTLGARDDHSHSIPKLFLINSESDLPAPDGSNIIHITEDGLYRFVNQVDLANATRSLARSVLVDAGVNADFESAVADVSTTNPFVGLTTNADRPTLTFSTQGGTHRRPFLVLHQETDQYAVVGPTEICEFQNWRVGSSGNSLGFKVRGDTTFGECLLYSRVQVAESCDYLEVNGGRSCGVTVATGSGGHLGMVKMTGVNPVDGVSGTLFECPDDNGLFSQGVYLVDCHAHATGKLFDIGDAFNQATGIPALVAIGCSGESVTLDSMPDGGVTIEGCRFRSATPFGGTAFDAEPHLTEGVIIRGCYRAGNLGGGYSLVKFAETPNPAIIVDENDDDLAVKPRLKFNGATAATVGDINEITITAPEPLLVYPMKWSTTLANGTDPSPGYIRGNQTIQPTISVLDIDNVTVGSTQNVSDWLGYLKTGQLVKIASRTNAARFLIFELTANADTNSGFVTLDVLRFSNGPTALGNDELVWLMPYGSRSLALRGGEMDASATINMNDGQISEIDALYVGKAGVSAPTTGQGLIFSRGNGILEPENIELIAGQGLARARLNTSQGTRPALANAITPVVWQVLHPPPSGQQYSATEIGRPMPVTGSNSFAVQAESHTWATVAATSSLSLFALSYASATEGPFGYNPNGWTGKVMVEGVIDLLLFSTAAAYRAKKLSISYCVDWASRNTAPSISSEILANHSWPYPTASIAVSGTNALVFVNINGGAGVPSGGARIAASITGRIRAMSHT